MTNQPKVSLENLQVKVQSMLDGEKKRRETAIQFTNVLHDILIDVAEDIWGSGESNYFDGTATVRIKDKEGKNKPTDFYFRYEKHVTERKDEDTGFYYSAEYPLWGTEIKDLKGADFWNAVRCIINWVPVLVEIIDNRNNSRDQLLSLVNVDQL